MFSKKELISAEQWWRSNEFVNEREFLIWMQDFLFFEKSWTIWQTAEIAFFLTVQWMKCCIFDADEIEFSRFQTTKLTDAFCHNEIWKRIKKTL